MEKSGFATVVRLIMNPKPIVDNYYRGFSKFYPSPGQILLYGIATVALHRYIVEDKILGLTFNLENIGSEYLFWIVLFPFLYFSSFITFYKAQSNLSKHLISITYLTTSIFIVLTVINDAVIILGKDLLGAWAFIVFMVLVFIWNSRVLSQKRRWYHIMLNALFQLLIFSSLISLFGLFIQRYTT